MPALTSLSVLLGGLSLVDAAETAGEHPSVKTGSRVAGWISDSMYPVCYGTPIVLHLSESIRDRASARQAVNAQLLATGLTEALKSLTDEPRPRRPECDRGFPSGHASAVWALATVLAHNYPEHEEVAYSYAVAMTWARRATRWHTWAQSLAGSLLGWACARVELNQSDGLFLHVSKPLPEDGEPASFRGNDPLAALDCGTALLEFRLSF
ncbi:MAG: phosphatase PAP2 family protein [Armatimonadota bacterium]